MAVNVEELILQARDAASAMINAVGASLRRLNTTVQSSGSAMAGFSRISGALAPSLGGVGAGVSQVVGELGALTSAGGAAAAAFAGVAIAGVALAGGAVVAAKSLGDDVERLDVLSAASGVAIGNLQVLQEFLKRQGLSADSASTALTFLNRAIANQNPLLKALGITTRDAWEALLQLSAAYESSTDAQAKAAIGMELLGRGGREWLGVIARFRGELPALRTEMEKVGQLFGVDAVEQGRKFDEQWDRMTGRFEGNMTRIKTSAATAVNAVLDLFDKVDARAKAVDLSLAVTIDTGEVRGTISRELQDALSEAQSVAFEPKVVVDVPAFAESITSATAEALGRVPPIVAEVNVAPRIQQSALLPPPTDDLSGAVVAPTIAPVQDLAASLREAEAIKKAREEAVQFAERVAELSQVLGVSREAAVGYAKQLDAVEDAEKRAAIAAKLFGDADLLKLGEQMKLIAANAEKAGFNPDFVKGLNEAKAAAEATDKALRDLTIHAKVPASPADLVAAQSAHAEAIKRVQDIAKGLSTELEHVSVVARATGFSPEFVKQLLDAKKAMEDTAKAMQELTVNSALPEGPPIPIDIQNQLDISALADPARFDEVRANWRLMLADITSGATVASNTIQAVFSGLQSGLTQVFGGLLSTGQTFGSAFATIFRSLASAVLAEIARIIAAELTAIAVTFILRAIMGPLSGVFGGGGAAAGGGQWASAGGHFATTGPGAETFSRRPVNINVNAYDTRGIYQDLQTNGPLAQALQRSAAGGRY